MNSMASLAAPKTPSTVFMRDSFGFYGANVLASKIRDYWLARGYDVQTVVDVETVFGHSIWVVRSDMINGWPKGKA